MAVDPAHYFRLEAREILASLAAGVLELERGPGADMPRLMRLAHTLKGAARVVGETEVGEQVHALEEALASAASLRPPVPPPRVRALLARLDAISERVFGRPGPHDDGSDGPEPVETVRVELREMDALLEAVATVGTRLAALRRPVEQLDGARRLLQAIEADLRTRPTRAWTRGELQAHLQSLLDQLSGVLAGCREDLADAQERSETELRVVHDRAQSMRLLPASLVFDALERATLDAAHELGKSVRFVGIGGDVRLGSHVIDLVREALLHVVRNAVAHGIEAPEARMAAGKPPQGRIRVVVERRADGISVNCSDDGAGLDVAAIGRAAARWGVIKASELPTLTLERAVAILTAGGVSTRESVDVLAGRGIGLSAVGAAVDRAHGRWTLRSERGVGTTIDIHVPPSLTSLLALEVRAAGRGGWIPANAVLRTAHVDPSALVRADGAAAVVDDGVAIPIVALSTLLAPLAPVTVERGGPVAIIEAEGRRVAVLVDALLGLRTILMHPLPAGLEPMPLVSGTTLDAEGHPELVFDPAGLVRARTSSPEASGSVVPGRRILVVDDSLTTRLLEQTILENAGYQVDLAVDAEEALIRARAREYAVILVDVEMPGMNGFEFVATVRADPTLERTACILVSSRAAPADAALGQEVGAAAYVVKGTFDQTMFLALIRRLVG